MDDIRDFHLAVFAALGDALPALVEEYAAFFGPVFSPKDLRWHERHDNETNQTAARLMWREEPILEMQQCHVTLRCNCLMTYPARKH